MTTVVILREALASRYGSLFTSYTSYILINWHPSNALPQSDLCCAAHAVQVAKKSYRFHPPIKNDEPLMSRLLTEPIGSRPPSRQSSTALSLPLTDQKVAMTLYLPHGQPRWHKTEPTSGSYVSAGRSLSRFLVGSIHVADVSVTR